jgi:hypothetical protein
MNRPTTPTRPISPAAIESLDSAIEAMFRFRSGFLAKAAGGATSYSVIADQFLDRAITIRAHCVARLRAQGASPAVLAKVAASGERLAKVSGVPLSGMSSAPVSSARQAEQAFQARIERVVARTRPDEYHPERR